MTGQMHEAREPFTQFRVASTCVKELESCSQLKSGIRSLIGYSNSLYTLQLEPLDCDFGRYPCDLCISDGFLNVFEYDFKIDLK